MTTLYPQTTKQIMNILFPKKVYEPHDRSRSLNDSLAREKPQILHVKSVFPFDPFPNSLIVDYDTVTVIHRSIPPIEHIETLPIDVITDVRIHRGLVLSTLEIIASNLRNPLSMAIIKLSPQDAICAHRVIECLMSIKRQNKAKEMYPAGNGSTIGTIGTYPN